MQALLNRAAATQVEVGRRPLSVYDEICRWHTRRPLTGTQVREWFDAYRQDWQREKGGHWAVTRGGGEVLGRIALRGLDFDDGIANVAYWVLPAARGAGVACGALRVLTAWALDEIGFHRLELDHLPVLVFDLQAVPSVRCGRRSRAAAAPSLPDCTDTRRGPRPISARAGERGSPTAPRSGATTAAGRTARAS
ncbi:GNAT family N-acetyltransferase [Streptomyces sp. NPDC006208]|uniref:GNAT family N-acetyltransferase n=1 Tax=Streptomyces sp. NPDC006208 TaxID=3156734 RepID=UPI0033BACBB9